MSHVQPVRVSVSVVCLGTGRAESALGLVRSRTVDELHLDYFPDAPPGSVGLRETEVRQLCDSGVSATIHLWGEVQSFQALGLQPRIGLRVIVQQNSLEDKETCRVLQDAGWETGWSVAAERWREYAALGDELGEVPRHVQVLTTTTPGRPGGSLATEAAAAISFFSSLGAEVSVDGGLTPAVIVAFRGVSLVVLGSNFLGTDPSPASDLPARLMSLRALRQPTLSAIDEAFEAVTVE
jgi:hypothetical protein